MTVSVHNIYQHDTNNEYSNGRKRICEYKGP